MSKQANIHHFKDNPLPVISTGSYGFPIDKGASIIVSRLKVWEKLHSFVTRLALFDERASAILNANALHSAYI